MDSLFAAVKRERRIFAVYNAMQPKGDIGSIAINDNCAILYQVRFVARNFEKPSYFLEHDMTLKLNQPGSNPQQRIQKIEYVRQMLVELKATTSSENEHMLAYFLEMAYFEACDVIDRLEKSTVKVSKRNQPSGMSM